MVISSTTLIMAAEKKKRERKENGKENPQHGDQSYKVFYNVAKGRLGDTF